MTHRRRAIKRALSTAAAGGGLIIATLAMLSTPAEAAPTRDVFTQSTPIYLGGDTYLKSTDEAYDIPTAGTTSPAPLEVEIGHAAQIVDLRVTVILAHDHPSDLELVLVGPTGEQVVLLNGAGGATPTEWEMTFSDSDSATVLAEGDPLPNRSEVRPASFGEIALVTDPPVTGGTDLSVFDGTNAAGAWRLFVNDVEAHEAEGAGWLSWILEVELATTPYPSELNVSGVGTVTDVNLVLDGVAGQLDDSDFLLVGPGGQLAMFMSEAGGDAEQADIDLTFDDQAAETIPNDPNEPVLPGSYQPFNYGVQDEFPQLGDLVQTPSSLSVFNGTDPNGTWRLYAVDDGGNNSVSSIDGWSLDLETDDLTAPNGTVSVAAGTAYATSAAVTLAVTASDPGPKASGAQQMRFSNDGATWSAFQPYAATAPWALAPGRDGSRAVFAQFRDGSGNLSPVVSDTIILDTRAPRVLKVKPRRDRTGVPPEARIKVVTTEPLARTSVTPTTALLTRKGGPTIEATLRVRAAKIILDPVRPLKAGAYRVMVTTGVTDLAGNAFDAERKPGTQALRWTFTV